MLNSNENEHDDRKRCIHCGEPATQRMSAAIGYVTIARASYTCIVNSAAT